MHKLATISMPEELYHRMETARGDLPRSIWVRLAIEAALASADSSHAAKKPAKTQRRSPATKLGRMKTGAQLAREQHAARMAELNKAKGL